MSSPSVPWRRARLLAPFVLVAGSRSVWPSPWGADDASAVRQHSKAPAQLVVPSDQRGGRYANWICRIVVMNGAVGPEAAQLLDMRSVGS